MHYIIILYLKLNYKIKYKNVLNCLFENDWCLYCVVIQIYFILYEV